MIMPDLPDYVKDSTFMDITMQGDEKISKIKTFEKFRKWKSFKCWRNALSRHKFQSAKQVTAKCL